MQSGINYSELVDTALRHVLRGALSQVVELGKMPDEHHFYITFVTDFPNVSMPGYLKERYPDKMTIVVQHQFDGLVVRKENFKIRLSFSGITECLEIPFAAVVEFADPSVNFALQFQSLAPDNDFDAPEIVSDAVFQDSGVPTTHKANSQSRKLADASALFSDETESNSESLSNEEDKEAGNVVTLDSYRQS